MEEIDRQIKQHPQQIISTGKVVKAMIINGLGFVSAPLYLFSEFFVGKATEHRLGEHSLAPVGDAGSRRFWEKELSQNILTMTE